jgi:hypothetical protein
VQKPSTQKIALFGGMAAAAAEAGLQLSGYQNTFLAWVFAATAVFFFCAAGILWATSRGWLRTSPWRVSHVPLSSAADRVHMATQDAPHSWMAESERSEADMLNWYANYIAERIAIYGKKRYRKQHELIPTEVVRCHHIAEGGAILREPYTGVAAYTELTVRRRELWSLLRKARKISW